MTKPIFLLVVFLALPSVMLALNHQAMQRISRSMKSVRSQDDQCVIDGVAYNSGSHVPSDNSCIHCTCYGGLVACQGPMCSFPECADSIDDSEHCCPFCPNGPNCVIKGEIVPSGHRELMSDDGHCKIFEICISNYEKRLEMECSHEYTE